MKQNPQTNKIHRVCFVLANYFWPWSLTWSVADIPSNTLLEKTYFPFASGQHLQMAS